MLLIAAFIVPLIEFFDHWDPPGLSNDTEYAVYALVFAICLVLLVCKLISSGALKLGFVSWRVFLHDERLDLSKPATPASLPSLRYSSFRYESDLQRNAPASTYRFGMSSR